MPENRYGFCGTRPTASGQQRRVELAHVDAVDEHRAAGGVEQPRDQVEQRGLAAAGAADDRGDLAGPRDQVDAAQHRLLGAGVAELDVAQLQVAVPVERGAPGSVGGTTLDVGVEHLLDALGADLGPRHHHEHEGRHHDRHQDLHQVAEERGQRADLHLPAVDPVPAEPQHGDAGEVHHQHHGREHQRHQPADAAARRRSARCWRRRSAPARASSRTNARITRMPVICSRSTRLIVSMRSCMSRNSGRIRRDDQRDDRRRAPAR